MNNTVAPFLHPRGWTPTSRSALVSLLLIASPACAQSPPASPPQAPSAAMPSMPGQNPPLPQSMPQSVPAKRIENHACKSSHTPVNLARIPAEGTTTLSYRIGTDGTVKDVAVTRSSGIDALDKAAAECVATWRFSPAMQNGKPVEVDKVLDLPWETR